MQPVRWIILVAMLSATLPLTAEAGLLGALRRAADGAGDAGDVGRKVDGIGGGEISGAVLRSAKDPNTSAVALGTDEFGAIRLTDELGRSVDVTGGADLDAALKSLSGGSGDVVVVADARILSRARDIPQALAERGALKYWDGKKAQPVRVSNGAMVVEPRPGLAVRLIEQGAPATSTAKPFFRVRTRALREIEHALQKPLNRGTVVVAEIGNAAKGPRKVGFGDGPSGKPGETISVTRDDLLGGFAGNRGGTVILSGRVDGAGIRAKGGTIPLAEIRAAAAAADVHLVILDGPAKAAHAALQKAGTYGDLLTGLAPAKTPMMIDASATSSTRVRLSMAPEVRAPAAPNAAPTRGDDALTVAQGVSDAVVHTAVHSIQLDTTDRAEEQDREMRLIPGVPFWVHLVYAVNLVFGLYGGRFAWRFWRRVWPIAMRPQRIAPVHIPRFLVFLLVFLPITGLLWAIIAFFAGIGGFIMAVLRLIGLAPRRRV